MTERTPTTANEKQAVLMLKGCRFAPASWDKRFVGQLNTEALTVKERPQVWRLFIRYRRQIQGMMVYSLKRNERQEQIGKFQTLLHEAAALAAPDFRKQAAMNAEAQRVKDAIS